MPCPITQDNYFFSVKLDAGEKILKCAEIHIGREVRRGSKIVIEETGKGYFAVTNKRCLIADAEGIYSIEDLIAYKITPTLFLPSYILFVILFLLFIVILYTVSEYNIWTSIFTIALFLFIIVWALLFKKSNKARVFGVGQFYRYMNENRVEVRVFSGVIWSDEVKIDKLIERPLFGRWF